MARSQPRSRHHAPRDRASKSNFELYAWLFMRALGLLLVVLVLGHLFVNLMLGDGIHQIDFAFVAGKWATRSGRSGTSLMLWLAQLHGTNGLRTIINDYPSETTPASALKTLLYFATLIVIVLGTLVIFTFDPCIDPNSTLVVCQVRDVATMP